MKDNPYGMPAFPTTKPLDGWGDPNRGMMLRDYFAGQALVSIAHANPSRNGVPVESLGGRAALAYEYADAMLRAREK